MAMVSVCLGLILALFIINQPHHIYGVACNFFQGSWVFNHSSLPLYDSIECPFINPGLNCLKNGRPDKSYLHYQWNPTLCHLPRFDGQDFVEKFRGKKIMFVGDSIGNNQWQSLACMLHDALPNTTYKFTQTKSLCTVTFLDYGLSIMYLKNGFLVDLVFEKVGRVLKLDSISRTQQWNGIDVLIFNSYHWWMHTGHLQTWDYFEVGGKLIKDMHRLKAYGIAMTTWSKWVDSNIDPSKSRVFLQGISAVHYQGKEWGQPTAANCAGQTKPVKGSTYPGYIYPGEAILKSVVSKMRTPVSLLDITLLTELRKDGHPSSFGDSGGIDCSHWCLAGVPESWNQILYAILINNYF